MAKKQKRTRIFIDFYNKDEIDLIMTLKAVLKESVPKQSINSQIRTLFLQTIENYLKEGKILNDLEETFINVINNKNSDMKIFNALTLKKSLIDPAIDLAQIKACLILLTNLMAEQFNLTEKVEVPDESLLQPFAFQNTIAKNIKSEQRNLISNFNKKKEMEES
ncbi:hypothetical protein [Mesoplasma melaleucae]|uniref:Uncharacterized protein n=1 Tax=Mesoplasma melaleucae TaxID=81459 RepID=A0A2K8NYI3_9MOLU|nr:hypothetical protein [Mesoplasma melaleucae]ATZ17811.1 hypothetical protein EMELA_v1c02380 [Mesoplasma melaleucae]